MKFSYNRQNIVYSFSDPTISGSRSRKFPGGEGRGGGGIGARTFTLKFTASRDFFVEKMQVLVASR